MFSGVKETLGFDRIRFMVTGSAICCSSMHDMATGGHCGGIICCAEARVGVGRAREA